ncbi:type II secretion system protein [Thiobacillus sp.]|uniref:pilus assembly FimT family protein n=1 Tax=Thiobacillus sp. TaxID=924 RepID=UPI00286E08D7|nr:type II secretion system protein [Thiobacillus sp.]
MSNLNRRFCGGFTFVELVLVLTIAGVLAAVAGPRMVDRTAFQTHGGAAEIRTALRYAQKLALAKNRKICVTITPPTSMALRLENPVAPAAACNQNVVRLGGNPAPTPPAVATYTVTLPTGINLASSAPTFSFDRFGRPNTGVSLTVGGSAPVTVTVEPETGYVY